ncbi:NUDIX hydrolase [Candidatus Woesearchaeota archaeon]|nr:NUDIX hydrolase [Candidatus Woesearchaeota archaeon]
MRVFPPYGLAIPGGMAEPEMSLEDNAIKEAKEETGLDVVLTNPEQPLCVHSKPGRDPRAHIASITYIARGYGTLNAGDDAKTARHYLFEELEEIVQQGEFAFRSHQRALKTYLQYRNERRDEQQK